MELFEGDFTRAEQCAGKTNEEELIIPSLPLRALPVCPVDDSRSFHNRSFRAVRIRSIIFLLTSGDKVGQASINSASRGPISPFCVMYILCEIMGKRRSFI